ncbi:MAG: sulfotransferase [Luteolibacter sp.]
MPTPHSNPTLAYILSLPRSGSTVLSAMLDKRKGIVSPPESCFPQVLGTVTSEERKNRRWMAALYIGSTFPPTQLNLDEAATCMEGTNEEILIALGRAVAAKLDRDPDEVRTVVWKTPRNVGMHAGPFSTPGKFIVLRRNPHNVFESQFRVGFGIKNRNPYRFSIFRESYEHAFARIPNERKLEVNYDDLPEVLTKIVGFLGLTDQGDWETSKSSLDLAAESCSWMSDVTKEFKNQDPDKRARLDPKQVRTLDLAMKLARPTRSILGPVRAHFDHQSLLWCKNRAIKLLEDADSKPPAPIG